MALSVLWLNGAKDLHPRRDTCPPCEVWYTPQEVLALIVTYEHNLDAIFRRLVWYVDLERALASECKQLLVYSEVLARDIHFSTILDKHIPKLLYWGKFVNCTPSLPCFWIVRS